jgi:hypothetical protein
MNGEIYNFLRKLIMNDFIHMGSGTNHLLLVDVASLVS